MRAPTSRIALHRLSFVGVEIVEDDDVARFQRRHDKLIDIGAETLAVDRSVEQAERVDAVVAQGGAETGATLDLLVRRSTDRAAGHVDLTGRLSRQAMWGAAMDVGEWLKGIGLGQYEATFREHEIDADVLPELTEADLEKIGVPFGHRKRLIKAIARLANAAPEQPEAAPPQPPPASPPPRTLRHDAERRPITVMFCDLVGSTSLAREARRRGLAQSRQRLSRRSLGRR